jgi:hypothetical protein
MGQVEHQPHHNSARALVPCLALTTRSYLSPQAWGRLALAAARVSKARAWCAWLTSLERHGALAARIEQLWYGRACTHARAALRAWARRGAAHLVLERRAAVALAFWHGASVRGCWVLWLEVYHRGLEPQASRS